MKYLGPKIYENLNWKDETHDIATKLNRVYSVLRFTTITVSSSTDKLFKPSYRTDSCRKNSVIISAINYWNKTQNMLEGQSLKSLYPTKIKNILTKIKNIRGKLY